MAIEDSEQMLREFERRIDEQLAQAERLKTEMAVVQATEHGLDGAVEVTVDSTGALAGLYLADAAMRRSGAELADEILAAARRAQAQLAEKVGRAVAGVFGTGSDTEQFVRQTYGERFGVPDDDSPADGDRRSW